MSDKSTIEWTFAERFRGVAGHPYEQGFDLRFVPEALVLPLTWARPRMIFVNSMSDLFHDDMPGDYQARVWQAMRLADWHTYQVVTKRADGMRARMAWILRKSGADPGRGERPLPNVWLGASVEDRKYGVPRIEQLRATPAAVRFLSVEPLLEDLGQLDLRGIDWVIVGGESGLGARPMQPEWVRSIRDQCVATGVAFFFKQWGGARKKTAGRELDGRTYDEMPESARAPYPGRAEAARRREAVAT